MKFRITILCENSVGPISGTLGEHGFSSLIEWNGGSLLFDTGGGETLLHNALRMNRDLRKISAAVCSHGHHDHTGGLRQFLNVAGRKKIFAHPDIFSPRYRVKDSGEAISIGLPFDRTFLEGLGADFDLNIGWREIFPSVFLTGEVKRRCGFETGDKGLYSDPLGTKEDALADDQALVILAPKGIVLVLGCCHSGLINTIEHAKEFTGEQRIQAVIGGTHLGYCGASQLDATIEALRTTNTAKIYGCHCTGFNASARLSREFPGRFMPAMVGTTIEI